MAAIDKLYATGKQCHQLRMWLYENKPDLVKYLQDDADWDSDKTRAISMFPQEADKWLLENCPIEWVTDQIREQYDLKPGETLGIQEPRS